MSIEKKDLETQAKARIIQQYKEFTKLNSVISENAEIGQTIEDTFYDMLELGNIDVMEGDNLDVIGERVGQPRELVNADLIYFFGFNGVSVTDGYGTEARYKSKTEARAGSVFLADPEYRIFLRDRISKNGTDATIQSLINQITIMLNASPVIVHEYGTMTISIEIGNILSETEKLLLVQYNLLPKPSGVKIDFIANGETDNMFGYHSSTLGYSTLADPDSGGVYATLI